MTRKKEVAEKKDTALVQAGMYEDDANSGFEDADADAYAIPFLTILQALSPQCDKANGEYIKGAESGEFYNTVSQERMSGEDGIRIVPVHYKRAFIEWKPRSAGGGFVAEHSVADGLELLKQSSKNDNNQDELANGNLLVDTRSHYVMVVDGTEFEGTVISMSSTQMKKSRRWMTVMQNLKMPRADGTGQFTPPMFSHIYDVTTVPESNDQGSWFGWKIVIAEQVTDANLFNAAKAFRDAILSGEAKEQVPAGDNTEKEEF